MCLCSKVFLVFSGWYRGRLRGSEESSWGIFPMSVVREGAGTGTTPPEAEPLVSETAAVLRDWGRIWRKLYVVSFFYCHNLLLGMYPVHFVFLVVNNTGC